MACVGVSHDFFLSDDFFLALPSALGMSNVHWIKLNLNAK